MSSKEVTLCIPRITSTTTKKFIFEKFKKLNWGKVDVIKEYNLKEAGYKMIIIKILWGNDENALMYKNKLLEGTTIKVVYNNPWYWRVIKYK